MKPVLAIALVGCSVSSFGNDVSFNASKAQQVLKVGDTLTFRLDAIPGAGYGWRPTLSGRPNMKYVAVSTLPSQKDSVGGKQTMVLKFLAAAPGEATITLNYGRPWLIKKGEKPDKTINAKVSVR